MCLASDGGLAHQVLDPTPVERMAMNPPFGRCTFVLHRCRACGARVWVSGLDRLTVAETTLRHIPNADRREE